MLKPHTENDLTPSNFGQTRAFAASSAHDLNNDLTVLIDCLERLDDEPQLADSELREDLKAGIEGVRRTVRLFDQVSSRTPVYSEDFQWKQELRASLSEELSFFELRLDGLERLVASRQRMTDLLSEVVRSFVRFGATSVVIEASIENQQQILIVSADPRSIEQSRMQRVRLLAYAVLLAHQGRADWSTDLHSATFSLPESVEEQSKDDGETSSPAGETSQ